MEERLVDGIREARAAAMDAARPDAVAAIHASGQLTARERLDALFDPGSFVEYGVLAEAAADDPGKARPMDWSREPVGSLDSRWLQPRMTKRSWMARRVNGTSES